MSGKKKQVSYSTLVVLGVIWLAVAATVWNTTDMNIAGALVATLWPTTLVALLIGMMNPHKVLPMMFRPSRLQVGLIFGVATLVFQVGGEFLLPQKAQQVTARNNDRFTDVDTMEWTSEEGAEGFVFDPDAPAREQEFKLDQREYFLVADTPERLAPHSEAQVAEIIPRGEKIYVYGTQHRWARISRFYDGSVEGVEGEVAKWVPFEALSKYKQSKHAQPEIAESAYHIQGIPGVGDHGLTERDVLILHAAARYFCESGKLPKVEYGDKSATREGMYYFNYGKHTNFFFSPADVPNLEERIAALNPQGDGVILHAQ